MELNLKRPLVVFDLETTGVNISEDRIVEISVIKVFPDGKEESFTQRINPGVHIPESSTEVHGISDEDVKDCPKFIDIAYDLYDKIKDCDIAGFNSNKFDVPVLVEEFLRSGVMVDFTKTKFVDVQNIFHKMEKRTLEAAYKFYCNKDLLNAHSAQADTRATYEVLKAQIEKYKELENDIDFLSDFSSYTKKVDFAGTLVYDDNGNIVVNFGKYKGFLLYDVFRTNAGYVDWILRSDFTLDTKNHFSMQYELYKKSEKR